MHVTWKAIFQHALEKRLCKKIYIKKLIFKKPI